MQRPCNPQAAVAMLWVLLTVHFPGEPATRAGNPGIARGSKPVAEVYTAARAVEWLIRLTFRVVISALEVQARCIAASLLSTFSFVIALAK